MRRLDRKKYLSPGEVARLLTVAHGFTDDAGRRDYVFLSTLLNTGLRIGELLELRVQDVVREDVSDERGAFVLYGVDVWNGKGEVSRRVYVHRRVYDVLADWSRGKTLDAHIFSHAWRGRTLPYTRRAFSYRLKRLLGLAGLPLWYKLHSMRHTYAMTYYEATHSLNQLKEQLGHTSLSTTQIYLATTKREHLKNLEAVEPMLAAKRRGGKIDGEG